jgi:hypothetical protein
VCPLFETSNLSSLLLRPVGITIHLPRGLAKQVLNSQCKPLPESDSLEK